MALKTYNAVTHFYRHSHPSETFGKAFQCQLQAGLTHAVVLHTFGCIYNRTI